MATLCHGDTRFYSKPLQLWKKLKQLEESTPVYHMPSSSAASTSAFFFILKGEPNALPHGGPKNQRIPWKKKSLSP